MKIAVSLGVCYLFLVLTVDVSSARRKHSSTKVIKEPIWIIRQQLIAAHKELQKTRNLLAAAQNCSSAPTWTYIPSVQKYYRVIFELVDWDTADSRCRELSSKSHLIVINNATESQAIKNFLASLDSNKTRICNMPDSTTVGGYWTSGQRADRTQCGDTPWVWKPYPGTQLPMTFTDWASGEPNCGWGGTEQCIHSGTDWFKNYQWNDLNCAWALCALCQRDL